MEELLDLMFTQVDGLPYPNLEIRNDTYIYEIIRRDTRLDYAGVKQRARKELAYVYFMANKTLYSGYTRSQKERVCKEKAGLAEGWMPDIIVLKCIEQVKQDVVTKQDKLLMALEDQAEDVLDMLSESKANNKRIQEFMKKGITDLSPEQVLERNKILSEAIEEVKKFGEAYKLVDQTIRQIDALKIERINAEKLRKKTMLSSTETNRSLFEPKIEIDV